MPRLFLVAMATKFETKLTITRLLLEIFAKFLRLLGGDFGIGPSNAAKEILPRSFLVAMATKFGTKLAITRLLLEISARSLHLWGFSGLGHRILPTKFYPD